MPLTLDRNLRRDCLRDTLETRNLVMGILNLTPDSFSDGGLYAAPSRALDRAFEMAEQGADLIDMGGESTRPGAAPVSSREQIERILPVLKRFRAESDLPVSIDTQDAEVARATLAEGADIINDVGALSGSREMAETVRGKRAGVILMHMRGSPRTMQTDTDYEDVVDEVRDFLAQRVAAATDSGIPAEDVWIDPGIGFGKSAEGNLRLLREIEAFDSIGCPLVVGVSRKSFIGTVLDREPSERLAGTLAVTSFVANSGVKRIHRVHDVAEARDALRMLETLTSKQA